MRGCIRKETTVAWAVFKRSPPPILDFWTFRVQPMKIFWPHFSPAVLLADPARESAAGTGLWSHGCRDFTGGGWFSWSCPIRPTRPPARTPPGFARQGGFLGRSTGTGAFVPPGLVPLQGGPPRVKVRFTLGLAHRQAMRTNKSQ
ncbi:hypothetical protein DMR_00930 [Solidesulfovibrio magneticus RS-1]|uniref:Uncharacterized protein n=1 Tax=Solidesulfovibrio magneticus (strain ATCC 700980 / DSM 13731 / RS-1) TaxID=573370 RepID=C4XTR9_SOLM1|nr:hypothetical protein DMR_00930 [Solidesulfovibrio magneticus RS-1]